MRARKGVGTIAAAAPHDGALRLVALAAAVLLLTQPPADAAAGDSAGAVAARPNPTAAAHSANLRASPNAAVRSKSPYAAWRAQREQAEAPDTSGHGHRAQMPEGQSRPRRVPQ